MTGSAADPADWQPHIRSKAAPRRAGQAVQGPARPAQDRHRPRHVADRLRRALPAHHVRRQADAGPRADAGHRPRQPRLQGQAGRAGRGLPRPGRRAASKAWRTTRRAAARARRRSTRRKRSPSCWRSTRSAAACSTASTSRKWITGTPAERLDRAASGAGAHPRAGGRQGPLRPSRHGALDGVRLGGAARRGASASATTSASSRPCAPC